MSALRDYLGYGMRIYVRRKYHYHSLGYKAFPDKYYYEALGFYKVPTTAP
jgi:hypothetical protein